MLIGKRARLDLEAVVPISSPQTFQGVASQRERAGLPLFDDVPVLMEHEPRIVEEIGRIASEVDAPATRGRDGATVTAGEQ